MTDHIDREDHINKEAEKLFEKLRTVIKEIPDLYSNMAVEITGKAILNIFTMFVVSIDDSLENKIRGIDEACEDIKNNIKQRYAH